MYYRNGNINVGKHKPRKAAIFKIYIRSINYFLYPKRSLWNLN